MQYLEPIWDAIDYEQYSQALTLITKAQKRQPRNKNLLNLQAFCLVRDNRVTEGLAICETIRRQAPDSDATYIAIRDVLKDVPDSEACKYMLEIAETGYRATKSEVLAKLWFSESVRSNALTSQRKAAVELQKGYLSRDYFYYVLMSMSLIWTNSTDEKEKSLLGMLMYRMMTKAAENTDPQSTGPRIQTMEEFLLYISILLKLENREEALNAMNGPHGLKYASNQECRLIKVDLLYRLDRKSESALYAKELIESDVDDWAFFKAYADSDSSALDFLCDWASKHRTRNALLAVVYASDLYASSDLYDQAIAYYTAFPAKLATFEDLLPYFSKLDPQRQNALLTKVETLNLSETDLIIHKTNFYKFKALQGSTVIDDCLREYQASISLGSTLLQTDNQYGDDLLLLACRQLTASQDLNRAVTLLESGLQHSPHNFRFKLLLLNLYRRLGAWTLAHATYTNLNIKETQNDTLGYTLLQNSVFEYCCTKQIAALEKTVTIHKSSTRETPAMICKAYEHGTYSKVEEFMEFRDRLANSLWKSEVAVSVIRLRILMDTFEWTQVIDVETDGLFNNKDRRVGYDDVERDDVGELKVWVGKLLALQSVVQGRQETISVSLDPIPLLTCGDQESLHVLGDAVERLKWHSLMKTRDARVRTLHESIKSSLNVATPDSKIGKSQLEGITCLRKVFDKIVL